MLIHLFNIVSEHQAREAAQEQRRLRNIEISKFDNRINKTILLEVPGGFCTFSKPRIRKIENGKYECKSRYFFANTLCPIGWDVIEKGETKEAAYDNLRKQMHQAADFDVIDFVARWKK